MTSQALGRGQAEGLRAATRGGCVGPPATAGGIAATGLGEYLTTCCAPSSLPVTRALSGVLVVIIGASAEGLETSMGLSRNFFPDPPRGPCAPRDPDGTIEVSCPVDPHPRGNMSVRGGDPERAAGVLGDPHPVGLADLGLQALRAYRRQLADEEDRVSYWRRLVHARLDVLAAEASQDGPLGLGTLARVLGDTGAGRTRTALVRVRAAEPLPDLPVLEEMWVTEVDADDPVAVAAAVERLQRAERQLTSYRRALHQRIDEATTELIERYRRDPASALVALEEGPA